MYSHIHVYSHILKYIHIFIYSKIFTYIQIYSRIQIHIHIDAKARAADFNARDAVFGFPPTEYALLDELLADFAPYFQLWTMCSDFSQKTLSWLQGPLLDLDAAEIEQKVF